ncbi:MAG TPA: hypothetical protein VGE94_04470 [Chloroflexota bacterium]
MTRTASGGFHRSVHATDEENYTMAENLSIALAALLRKAGR